MSKLLFLFIAMFVVWYAYRWWKKQDPVAAKKSLLTFGLWGGAAVLILLTLTGRVHWITGAIAALIPLAKASFPYLRRLMPFALQWQKSRASQQRQLMGEWLQLTVSPVNGKVDGKVLKGSDKGLALSSLTEAQLKALLTSCLSSDVKSAQLLAVFLQQAYGEQWQSSFTEELSGQHSSQSFNSGAPSDSLSEKEACEMLGVSSDATKEDINHAYKSLMQKVHPDRGGNDYLSRLVAQAKEVLLRRFD